MATATEGIEVALFDQDMTYPQDGLFGSAGNTRLPLIDNGVPPAAMAQPQAAQSQGGFDPQTMALLGNPMLQLGLNLIGGARTPGNMGWSNAINNTLASQFQAQAGQRANRKIALEEAEGKAKIPLYEAQATNMNAESQLHGAQAHLALRQQAMLEAAAQRFGAGLNQTPNQGVDPNIQQISQPAGQPALGGQPMQGQPTLGGQAQQQSPQGATADFINRLPPALVQAIQLDFMTNQGKGVPALLAKADEPIPMHNGLIATRGPNGFTIDPNSMAASQQMAAYNKGLDTGTSFVEVPQPGGGTKMMRKDVAIAAAGGPGGVGANNLANNNFGNIRPPGQSQGFASYPTPEAGIQAIDSNLATYGQQHGINTVRGVVGRWLGGGADGDNVGAAVNNISKMSGFGADDKIDLSNPATRHILSGAIMRQEHGNAAFAQPQQGTQTGAGGNEPGVVGRTPSIAEKNAMELTQADTKANLEMWNKHYDTAVTAASGAAEKKANMQLLNGYLDGIKTGTLAPTTLAVNKFAAGLGFKIPENTPNMEATRALSQQMIFELRDPKQGGGLPGSMSNWEDKLLLSMIPGIDKLPGANKILSDVYIRKQERVQGIAQVMADYRKENGRLDDGIQNAIAKYRDDHPLFTAQERQQVEGALNAKPAAAPMTRISPRETAGKITGPGQDAAGGNGSSAPSGVKFLGFE